MSTDLSPPQAAALLALHFKLKRYDDTHVGGFGVWVAVTRKILYGQDFISGKNLVEEAFDFRSDLEITLVPQPDDDDDPVEGYRFLLRATIFLLDHCRDAVLLFNGEIIVLQRLGGKLVLNENYNIW